MSPERVKAEVRICRCSLGIAEESHEEGGGFREEPKDRSKHAFFYMPSLPLMLESRAAKKNTGIRIRSRHFDYVALGISLVRPIR